VVCQTKCDDDCDLISAQRFEQKAGDSTPPRKIIYDISQRSTCEKKHPRTHQEIEDRRLQALKRRNSLADLRDEQKEALICICESDESTMIIMPTGIGKSRLIWSHKKPGLCSVIFAPFKFLVQQLTYILKEHGIVFTSPFPSDISVLAMIATADFIVMPYEAAPESEGLLSSLHTCGRLGPIWIDEVRYR
jgi:hypothetical protein